MIMKLEKKDTRGPDLMLVVSIACVVVWWWMFNLERYSMPPDLALKEYYEEQNEQFRKQELNNK